jgi:hypothetical protein
METQHRYEIFLNHISAVEFLKYPNHYDEYTKAVIDMLVCHDKFHFEDDLLEELKDDPALQEITKGESLTMDHVKMIYPERYFHTGDHRKKNEADEQFIRIWFDVWDKVFVPPTNEMFYDLFFSYKLHSLDLLEIDTFLDYQLANWHGNDTDKFIRFLQLVVRKHGAKMLSPAYIQTIKEWALAQKKETALSGIEIKTKGKSRREAEDNATALNQEQTALLIHFLQQSKIIRRDENLSNKEAGQAFSILTGYSADTLRQSLGKTDLEQIATKKNLAQVDSVLSRLATLIDNKILARK